LVFFFVLLFFSYLGVTLFMYGESGKRKLGRFFAVDNAGCILDFECVCFFFFRADAGFFFFLGGVMFFFFFF